MLKRVICLIAVSALLLSGCTGPSDSGASNGLISAPSPLSRHITMDIDTSKTDAMEDAEDPQEALARIVSVRFDYVHRGASVAPSSVTVSYTGLDGTPAEAMLSAFTSSASIKAGDVVKIAPGTGGSPAAQILTGMTLTADGKTLFARTGVDREWMTAQGVPIPVAFSTSGKASWTMTGSADFQAHVAGIDVGSGGRLDRLDVSLDTDMDGRLDLTTSQASAGPRLSLDADFTVTETIDVSGAATMEGRTEEASVEGTLTFEVPKLAADFQFDQNNDLDSITFEAEAELDGDLEMGGAAAEAPEMPHPLFHESFGPETTQIPPPDEAITEDVVQFLSTLWGIDLATGDEIVFHLNVPSQAGLPSVDVDYTSQVLGVEDREVGGKDRPTFKLSDTFSAKVAAAGSSAKEFSYDYNYWVDQESYLPVYMQGEFDRTFTRAEILDYLRFVQDIAGDFGGAEIPLPTDASFTITTESTMELVSDSTDLSQAAVLSAGGARTIPLAAVVFVLTQKLSEVGPVSYEDAPQISFVADNSARSVTVVRAPTGTLAVQWGDATHPGIVPVCSSGTAVVIDYEGAPVPRTGIKDVQAADTISGCRAGSTLTITDTVTDNVLYTATFP